MFAGIIFEREPFFKGDDNHDQLVKIVRVLGSEKFHQYVLKYNIELEPPIAGLIDGQDGIPWNHYTKKSPVNPLVDDEAIDLLSKMLRYDHAERI